MVYTPRRPRRTLPRSSTMSLNKSVANVILLIVALTVILLSRCDSKPSQTDASGSWVDYLITPKHLRLPKSVIDVQQERARTIQESTIVPRRGDQDRSQHTSGGPD